MVSRVRRWVVVLANSLVRPRAAVIAALAVVAASGCGASLNRGDRPAAPPGWTGLVGQLKVPFSVEPLSTVWIVNSDGTVREAHADRNGWFQIPLAAGSYNITYEHTPSCLRFYGNVAVLVPNGQAVWFDRTSTGCVQGY